MVKGTPSFGKKQKRTHISCRRCGKKTYHVRKKACSSCGFGRSRRIKKVASAWKRVLGKRNRKR